MVNQKNTEIGKNQNKVVSTSNTHYQKNEYHKKIETIKDTLKKFENNNRLDELPEFPLDLIDYGDPKEKINFISKSIDIKEQQNKRDQYEEELRKEIPNIIKIIPRTLFKNSGE